jgi:hypothetical protein
MGGIHLLWGCCLFLFLLQSARAAEPTLPLVSVTAHSHYELGFAVGSHFKSRIRGYLDNDQTLHQQLIPFVSTPPGHKLFLQLFEATSKRYPHYIEELKGQAAGAGVNPQWLLLLSFTLELSQAQANNLTTASPQSKSSFGNFDDFPSADDLSCSDIFVNDGQVSMFGHNEDSGPLVRDYAFLVEVRLLDAKNKTVEAFTAYNYPGMLPGNGFGFNQHGIAHSVNAVYPKQLRTDGVGRYYINRDILGSTSIEDAIARATIPDRAYGFSLNVASTKDFRILNIEVAPEAYAVTEVSGNFSHFNMYKVLLVPQYSNPSTIHRAARANQMAAPRNEKDILMILGDQGDRQYPIYRDGQPPDSGVTEVSALFNLRQKLVTLWLYNPKTNPALRTLRLY